MLDKMEEELDNKGDELSDNEFEIQCIVDHRVDSQGNTKYLVRWLGYSSSADSWVEEDKMDAPEIVKEYYR